MASDDPPAHFTEELPLNEKTLEASPSRPFCSEPCTEVRLYANFINHT